MTAFSWCWYQSLVSNLTHPPPAFVWDFLTIVSVIFFIPPKGLSILISLCSKRSGGGSSRSYQHSHNRLGEGLGRESRQHPLLQRDLQLGDCDGGWTMKQLPAAVAFSSLLIKFL